MKVTPIYNLGNKPHHIHISKHLTRFLPISPGVAHQRALRKTKAREGVVHLHIQPLPLPVLPLVLSGKGKEAGATPPKEDIADGAVLRGGAGTGERDGDRIRLKKWRKSVRKKRKDEDDVGGGVVLLQRRHEEQREGWTNPTKR